MNQSEECQGKICRCTSSICGCQGEGAAGFRIPKLWVFWHEEQLVQVQGRKLSSEGFQLQISHWRCPCICWQVKLRKCLWSSGCVQFKVGTGVMHALFRGWSCTSEGCQADVFSSRFHIWGVKVIKWTSSVPVLAVEVCKYLLASRDVQVTVFKWIYSAPCLAVEARKYRLASDVVQVKVVNSCAEATRQRHERHVKKKMHILNSNAT